MDKMAQSNEIRVAAVRMMFATFGISSWMVEKERQYCLDTNWIRHFESIVPQPTAHSFVNDSQYCVKIPSRVTNWCVLDIPASLSK